MFDQLVAIISITLLVMISPGPDMVIVARNTITGRRRDGLLTSLGILSGNMVHITYSVVGIGFLISQSIFAFNALKYAGAIYLIYLGYKSIRAKAVPLNEIAVDERNSGKSCFLQGFLNNILNPKGSLFYLGVFTVVIIPETSLFETTILIITMMFVSASFWVVFVLTLNLRSVRSFFDRAQIAINRTFGVLLIILGVRVAFLQR